MERRGFLDITTKYNTFQTNIQKGVLKFMISPSQLVYVISLNKLALAYKQPNFLKKLKNWILILVARRYHIEIIEKIRFQDQ